jgi:hypothetical protein
MKRIRTLSLLLAVLLSSCGLPAAPVPTLPGGYILVTANPRGSATPTPFQPATGPLATLTLPPVPPTYTPRPPTVTPTFTASPTLPPPTDTLPPTFTATSQPPSTRTQYLLYATLDYAAHTVHVDQGILYTNQAGGSMSEVVLSVEPNRWPGVFTLNAVQVDSVATSNYRLNGHQMVIGLGKVMPPGDRTLIYLNYDLNIPYKNSDRVFGYDADQVNLIDWLPTIVPYDATGWVLHEPSSEGEYMVYDSADFDVRLRLTDPYAGVVVAASAPGEPDGEWMRYHLYGARTFVFSASPYFEVQSAWVNGVQISSYYFPVHESGGVALLSAASLAMITYGDRFAPYPHASLSVVEAHLPDGMEADGLVFMSDRFYSSYDGTYQNNLVAIGVHEIAHQWWYGLVGNDQAMEPWLDEALCTYSERVFFAVNYPELVDWWWGFRINYYSPGGYINTNVYSAGGFRPYVNAVYLRGALFLDDLRVRIGNDAFYAFLKDYAARYAFQRVTHADFFSTLDLHTDTDYSDLVREYFR